MVSLFIVGPGILYALGRRSEHCFANVTFWMLIFFKLKSGLHNVLFSIL